MNVVFLEPAFPANQRAFVLALAEVGATVIGIGERPTDWLDDELKGAMAHYHQVHSVVDEGALLDAVRQIRAWSGSTASRRRSRPTSWPRSTSARRARSRGRSRSAFLCRDKPADEGGAARRGRRALRGVDRRRVAREVEEFSPAVGFLVIVKLGLRRRHVGDAGQISSSRGRRRCPCTGVDRGTGIVVEEFIEGHEGFYDTISVEGEAGTEFVCTLPRRAARDARPVGVTTGGCHQPRSDEAGVTTRYCDLAARYQGAGHRDSATHMEWFSGRRAEVLRDRVRRRREAVGPRRRRQRHRHLSGVGGGASRGARPAVAPMSCRFAAGSIDPRPDHDGHRWLRRIGRGAAAVRRMDHRPPPPAGRPRRSPSRPVTWPTHGYASSTPTSITCSGCSTKSARWPRSAPDEEPWCRDAARSAAADADAARRRA